MNGLHWRTARRAALLTACVAFFAAIAIIGQVADGNPVPQPPGLLLDARR